MGIDYLDKLNLCAPEIRDTGMFHLQAFMLNDVSLI